MAVEKLVLPPGRPTQPNVQDLCSVWGGPLRVSGAKTYTVISEEEKLSCAGGRLCLGPTGPSCARGWCLVTSKDMSLLELSAKSKLAKWVKSHEHCPSSLTQEICLG